MAFGIPTDQRSQIMLLLVIAALAGGYFFWSYLHGPQSARIAETKGQIDSLQAVVDKAKGDLASGSVEDLRRKVQQYQAAVALMRRLVPERNEVPTLIDDISNRAKVRGVTIGRIQPLTPEQGAPFDTYRYRLEIYGHYDQLGEFLADVASLSRIVVPQELSLRPAQQQAQKFLDRKSVV